MKRFILLFAVLLVIPVVCSVEIAGPVNDYANVISPDYRAKVEAISYSMLDAGVAEYAVVTIDSLNGTDIESYSYNLANNKLGSKDKNNGLLLLVAIDDHKYRFEVGRGLEPILNDAKVGRIGRNYLVQNFRNSDYGKGIYEASMAVQSILMNDSNSSYYVRDSKTSSSDNIALAVIFALFFAIATAMIICILIINSRKRSVIKKTKNKKKDDDFFIAAVLASIMFRGGGGFGGGGFGGGSSGGFGGGGSFGGGGAGSGW